MAAIDYKEKLRLAKEALESGSYDKETIEYIFPELAESEDERIRKHLIGVVELYYGNTDEQEKKDCLAWLEKQGTERKQLYVRFGDIPPNEKSKIYRGEEEIGDENGVSVYPAFELNGNIVLGLTLPITRTTLYTQQHLLEYDNRPCYLVSGDYAGKGTDGEPLIRNISIIKRLDNYRIKESEKQGAQKPVEDRYMEGYLNGINDASKTLKSDAWSEEDEKQARQIERIVSNDGCTKQLQEQIHNWFKSLKGRVQPLPKHEWSEEDENRYKNLCEVIDDSDWNEASKNGFKLWLKSLRPNSQWKPSENELEVLRLAAEKDGTCLMGLYEQLKKLRGE